MSPFDEQEWELDEGVGAWADGEAQCDDDDDDELGGDWPDEEPAVAAYEDGWEEAVTDAYDDEHRPASRRPSQLAGMALLALAATVVLALVLVGCLRSAHRPHGSGWGTRAAASRPLSQPPRSSWASVAGAASARAVAPGRSARSLAARRSGRAADRRRFVRHRDERHLEPRPLLIGLAAPAASWPSVPSDSGESQLASEFGFER